LELAVGLDAIERSLVAVPTVTCWTAVERAVLNMCRNAPKNVTQLWSLKIRALLSFVYGGFRLYLY
jgi:hypothetical protein